MWIDRIIKQFPIHPRDNGYFRLVNWNCLLCRLVTRSYSRGIFLLIFEFWWLLHAKSYPISALVPLVTYEPLTALNQPNFHFQMIMYHIFSLVLQFITLHPPICSHFFEFSIHFWLLILFQPLNFFNFLFKPHLFLY